MLLVEIVLLSSAIAAIRDRARQRGLSWMPYAATAVVGWLVLLLFGIKELGFLVFIPRWLWIGGVYLEILRTKRNARVESRWQCPDCQMFNDGATLICLCGYRHPDAAGVLDS